jgi:hypothetical protein
LTCYYQVPGRYRVRDSVIPTPAPLPRACLSVDRGKLNFGIIGNSWYLLFIYKLYNNFHPSFHSGQQARSLSFGEFFRLKASGFGLFLPTPTPLPDFIPIFIGTIPYLIDNK